MRNNWYEAYEEAKDHYYNKGLYFCRMYADMATRISRWSRTIPENSLFAFIEEEKRIIRSPGKRQCIDDWYANEFEKTLDK